MGVDGWFGLRLEFGRRWGWGPAVAGVDGWAEEAGDGSDECRGVGADEAGDGWVRGGGELGHAGVEVEIGRAHV